MLKMVEKVDKCNPDWKNVNKQTIKNATENGTAKWLE